MRHFASLRRTMEPEDSAAGVKAYKAGVEAARQGFSRTSPYYEKPFLDAAFFRGYDTKKAAPQTVFLTSGISTQAK